MPKRVSLEEINRKLDKVISAQKRLFSEESAVHSEEKEVHREEVEELRKLTELEAVEKELVREIGEHPLQKISYKDVAKGSVGAFIGIVAHFTFRYGVEVAAEISVARASLLLPISYAIGGIFMYMTGFRRIKDPKIVSFLPVRLTILYFVAILTAILVLIFFNPEFFHDFWTAYKQVATVTLSAVIGACTADLIGKE